MRNASCIRRNLWLYIAYQAIKRTTSLSHHWLAETGGFGESFARLRLVYTNAPSAATMTAAITPRTNGEDRTDKIEEPPPATGATDRIFETVRL